VNAEGHRCKLPSLAVGLEAQVSLPVVRLVRSTTNTRVPSTEFRTSGMEMREVQTTGDTQQAQVASPTARRLHDVEALSSHLSGTHLEAQKLEGAPLSRTSSTSSTKSIDEIEAMDIASEIKRISSPVVSYVDHRGLLDEVQSYSADLVNEEAARKIQGWWKAILRLRRTVAALVTEEVLQATASLFSAVPSTPQSDAHRGSSLLDRLKAATSTEDAIAQTSTQTAAQAVTLLLLGLPRDAMLRRLNVALHGPRAFLSAMLVVCKPESVLGNHHGSFEGRVLINASQMLLTAAKRLTECIHAMPAGTGHRTMAEMRYFRARLIMIRLARRYHAVAFKTWKRADSDRVAFRMFAPYGECFGAILQARMKGDAALEGAAGRQMAEIRAAIHQLMGEARAGPKLQEVEAAVRQRLEDAMAYVQQTRQSGGSPSSTGSPSPTSVAASGSEAQARQEGDGAARAGPGPAPQESTGPQDPEASGAVSLHDALVNEQLAHELILNSEFQLPALDDPPEFRPPTDPSTDPGSWLHVTRPTGREQVSQSEMMGRVQDTMQKLFWQRLVMSLTPSAQNGPEDFHVGSIVQARYGGANGAYYSARITEHHEDGTFAIVYLQDGESEARVPVSNFRLASDPVDARPLLALITEVRKRLEDATPKRADLHALYRDVLDAPLLKQMLLKGVLDYQAISNLASFVLDAISKLEAPARAERTHAWKTAFVAYLQQQVQQPASAESNSTQAHATSTPAAQATVSPLVRVLPAFFTFVNKALDQLQRDTVNFHLRMLAPRLVGDEAVRFERQRFQAKLERNLISLDRTKHWLSQATGFFCNEDASRRPVLLDVSAVAHRATLRRCVIEAFIHLVKQPVRWDSSMAAQVIPETLSWDGPRLAKIRDAMDRIILVASIIVAFQQVLSMYPTVNANADVLDDLRRKLNWLLTQPETRLASLQHAAVQALEDSARRSSSQALPAESVESLKRLVSKATDPSNTIFSLFTKRAYQILLAMATTEESARVAQTLDSHLGPSGLASFRDVLLEAGRLMNRLIQHQVAVHLPKYAEFIRQAATSTPGQAAASLD